MKIVVARELVAAACERAGLAPGLAAVALFHAPIRRAREPDVCGSRGSRGCHAYCCAATVCGAWVIVVATVCVSTGTAAFTPSRHLPTFAFSAS